MWYNVAHDIWFLTINTEYGGSWLLEAPWRLIWSGSALAQVVQGISDHIEPFPVEKNQFMVKCDTMLHISFDFFH